VGKFASSVDNMVRGLGAAGARPPGVTYPKLRRY
jgi:hypothetical protein